MADGFDDVSYGPADDELPGDEVVSFALALPMLWVLVLTLLGILATAAYRYLDQKQKRGDFRVPSMVQYRLYSLSLSLSIYLHLTPAYYKYDV